MEAIEAFNAMMEDKRVSVLEKSILKDLKRHFPFELNSFKIDSIEKFGVVITADFDCKFLVKFDKIKLI